MSFDITDILQYGSRIIVIFMCIPVHECAHAWAATKLGDETPTYQGRLTLNPFAHMDIIGTLGILLTGFGWGKPVQVNPLRFKQYRKGMALTAAAGPASNIVFALLTTIIGKFLYGAAVANGGEAIYWLYLICRYVTIINVGLAVFNLVPLYPLDGQKILAYFVGPKVNAFMDTYRTQLSLALIILIFSGVIDTPLNYLQTGILWLMDKLTIWVDPIVNAIF